MTMLVEPTNWGGAGVPAPPGQSSRPADLPGAQSTVEPLDLRTAVERACCQPDTGREFTQWLRDLVIRLEQPAG